MLDHVTVRVTNFEASRAFYTTVLAPLGVALTYENETVGFAEWGDFSIALDAGVVSRDVHVAFAATSREQVDGFHRAGIEAGYRDHGSPGERTVYHPGYYGAYLLDPDANNVEAVFHDRA